MLAMITGEAGGIGGAMAAECAGRGWDVFLLDIHEENLNKAREPGPGTVASRT